MPLGQGAVAKLGLGAGRLDSATSLFTGKSCHHWWLEHLSAQTAQGLVISA